MLSLIPLYKAKSLSSESNYGSEMVKKRRVGEKSKGKKLKRSKLLVYEGRKRKNGYMAFLNL